MAAHYCLYLWLRKKKHESDHLIQTISNANIRKQRAFIYQRRKKQQQSSHRITVQIGQRTQGFVYIGYRVYWM